MELDFGTTNILGSFLFWRKEVSKEVELRLYDEEQNKNHRFTMFDLIECNPEVLIFVNNNGTFRFELLRDKNFLNVFAKTTYDYLLKRQVLFCDYESFLEKYICDINNENRSLLKEKEKQEQMCEGDSSSFTRGIKVLPISFFEVVTKFFISDGITVVKLCLFYCLFYSLFPFLKDGLFFEVFSNFLYIMFLVDSSALFVLFLVSCFKYVFPKE